MVGSVNDVAVMQAVFDQSDILHQPVSEVMGRAVSGARAVRRNRRAYKLLTLANPAIVVTDEGEPIGVADAPRHHHFSLDQLRCRP